MPMDTAPQAMIIPSFATAYPLEALGEVAHGRSIGDSWSGSAAKMHMGAAPRRQQAYLKAVASSGHSVATEAAVAVT